MHLYLSSYQRIEFIEDIVTIKKLYIERIHPIFANPEMEADKVRKAEWEAAGMLYSPETSDPGVIAEQVEERAYKRYSILSLMQYRNLALWISCLCQVWEQQLLSLVISEAGHKENEGLVDREKGLDFGSLKSIFAQHNVSFDELKCWDKVNELRLLVNVIKHSEGNSEKKLRKIRPDYFQLEAGSKKYELLDFYGTTLNERTLSIKQNDLCEYAIALIAFWKELPEHMYQQGFGC